MVYRWWGQTTTVISESRGRHGPPPLRVPEQAQLAALITSEGTTEEDIVTKHQLFLPREDTCPAAATATATAEHCHCHCRALPLLRNHSQLKEQENSHEAATNETDL